MSNTGSSVTYTGEMGSQLLQSIGTGKVAWVGTSSSSTDFTSSLLKTNQASCPFSGFDSLCQIYQNILPQGTATPGFGTHVLEFIFFVLYPIALMLSMTAVVIGVILFIVGIHRLRHHHAHHQGKQFSYMGTVAYFVAGVILIQYGPLLHMVSSSTFFGFYGSNVQYMPTVLSYVQCSSGTSCLNNLEPGDYVQKLTFSLLLVVGLFSFLRGVFLLIKLGEGGGAEGGTLSKSLAHIVAGVIGVNAEATWYLLKDITSVLGVSSPIVGS